MMRTSVFLILLAAALLSRPASAEACAPAARVAGPSELVVELRRELLIAGVDVDVARDCPVVRVQVLAHDDHLELVLSDAGGRTARRSVGSVATAAAVIASWSRIAAPGEWQPRPPAPQPRADASAPPPGHTREREGGIALALETGFDSHDRRWLGASLSGCVTVGRACVGLLGRAGSSQYVSSSDPRLPTLVGGDGFDVLGTVAVPVPVGSFTVSPELGAGYGRVDFDWDYGPNSRYQTRASGVRLGARVSALRAMGRGFALELAGAADVLPAHYIRYDVDGPPAQRFDYNTTFRLSLGLRHIGR